MWKHKLHRFDGICFIFSLMECFNAKYQAEVEDKRYIVLSDEDILLGEQKGPKSLGSQYQVFNFTQIR